MIKEELLLKPIRLLANIRKKYFQDTNPKEAEEIIDKALAAWFKKKDEEAHMFDSEQLKQVEPAYLNIIMADDMDVTVQSRNIGHSGICTAPAIRLTNPVSSFINTNLVIRIKWFLGKNSLWQAIRSIQSHDRWQMNGKRR